MKRSTLLRHKHNFSLCWRYTRTRLSLLKKQKRLLSVKRICLHCLWVKLMWVLAYSSRTCRWAVINIGTHVRFRDLRLTCLKRFRMIWLFTSRFWNNWSSNVTSIYCTFPHNHVDNITIFPRWCHTSATLTSSSPVMSSVHPGNMSKHEIQQIDLY